MQTKTRASAKRPVQKPMRLEMYRRFIKRPMDFIFSLCALVVLSPVMLAVAVLVKINLGSPVIFKQKRPGLNEKIFTLYKFRTMTDARDENGNLLPDEVRLTRFGRWLRSTSLDELPELMNILKGDMSFVGPRPLAIAYLPFYSESERHRHDVRPGLSGLAQVRGRNAISWEDRFTYDNQYVNNITLVGDVILIFETLMAVIKREGIVVRGTGNVEDFHTYRARQWGVSVPDEHRW